MRAYRRAVFCAADYGIANDARLDVTLRTLDGNDNVQVKT